MFFFFNDTATTEIYTLSLHDALPIFYASAARRGASGAVQVADRWHLTHNLADALERFAVRVLATYRKELKVQDRRTARRSEEHTSELQSRQYLVCRLLLEKKKIIFPK